MPDSEIQNPDMPKIGRPAQSRDIAAIDDGITPEHVENANNRAIAVIAATREINENAVILAQKLGYDGEISVSAIESNLRHNLNRSAEHYYLAGSDLLMLKEITPHGEFTSKCEALGLSERAIRNLMATAAKLSALPNRQSIAVLTNTMSATKILDIATSLEPDELEKFANGEAVRNGIKLDEISSYSTRELRKKLREERREKEDLAADLVVARQGRAKADEERAKMREELTKIKNDVDSARQLALAAEDANIRAIEDAALKLQPAFNQFTQSLANFYANKPSPAAIARADGLVAWAIMGVMRNAYENGLEIQNMTPEMPEILQKALGNQSQSAPIDAEYISPENDGE